MQNNYKSLPVPYPSLIDSSIESYKNIYNKNLLNIILCGGCGRGNVIAGHSDIDFLLILKDKQSSTRFFENGIKISTTNMTQRELGNVKALNGKLLYFFRCFERNKAELLYGREETIPNVDFSLLKAASSKKDNIEWLNDVCKEDLANLDVNESQENVLKLLKHHNTFMKNMLFCYDVEQDDYIEVNKSFYNMFPADKNTHIPTPQEYLFKGNAWTNDTIKSNSANFLSFYYPYFLGKLVPNG